MSVYTSRKKRRTFVKNVYDRKKDRKDLQNFSLLKDTWSKNGPPILKGLMNILLTCSLYITIIKLVRKYVTLRKIYIITDVCVFGRVCTTWFPKSWQLIT